MAIPTRYQILEAERLYALGASLDRISSDLGLSRSTLRRRLIERGIIFRQDHLFRKLDADGAARAIKLYTSGKSLLETGALLGTTAETVRKSILAAGIDRRPAWRTKYAVNADSFAQIVNQEQAYWLGFIAADGCIFRYPESNRRFLSLFLSRKDRAHLETFRFWLGSEHPIRDYINAGFGKNSYASQFQVHSSRLCLDLEQYGITPRKSLALKWPSTIPNHLIPHYLRGYFDGDGCFSIYRNRKTLIFTVVSSHEFLLGLQDYLADSLSFSRTKLKRARCKAPIFTLICGGSQKSLQFAECIYSGASVCLPRKRQVVRDFLAMRPDCAKVFPDLL